MATVVPIVPNEKNGKTDKHPIDDDDEIEFRAVNQIKKLEVRESTLTKLRNKRKEFVWQVYLHEVYFTLKDDRSVFIRKSPPIVGRKGFLFLLLEVL